MILVHRHEFASQAVETLEYVWPEVEIGVVNGTQDNHDAYVVVASVQSLQRKRLERYDPKAFPSVVILEGVVLVSRWTIGLRDGVANRQPAYDATASDMTIIVVMSEILPLAYVKAHLSEIADRVERQHDRVILTRNGRPAAVLVSPEDLEVLEETLDILSDENALREIQEAREEISRGDTVDGDFLRSKYLKR